MVRQFEQLPPDKVIFNFSQRILTDAEKEVLSLGLKYCFHPRKLNFTKYFLSFENLTKQLFRNEIYECIPNALSYVKSSVKTIAFKYYYSYKSPASIREKRYRSILKQLSSDKNIIVTKPDKGTGVVILNKSDYLRKMKQILDDPSKFEKVNTDILKTILKLEDKTNRFIDKLYKLKIVNENLKTNLKTSGSSPGIMYGLPKVHKANTPMRPILSTIGTHNYKLSKYLITKLAPIVDSTYTLEDSFHFANEISNFSHRGCVMASFDVKSLFSNIPIAETCSLILDKLFLDEKCTYLGFNRNEFNCLLKLCCRDNLFMFDEQLYIQKDGAPMGGCVSPTLANFFLGHFEKLWLESCPEHFRPIYYRRYVDDTFLLFKDPNHVTLFHNYVNSQHPNICFTYEIEKNGQLPFLDTIVTKLDFTFETGLYRKPTFTGLGMKFDSSLPKTYKLNLIDCFLDRAHKLCSTMTLFYSEIENLKKFFFQNGFPIKLVEGKIRKKLSDIHNSKPIVHTVPKLDIYACFPFLDKTSNRKIHDEIQEIITKFYPQINLKIIFKNNNTISSFFNFKDRIPDEVRSNIVYKYCCGQCCATYYGETTRHLRTRIAEHLGLSARTGKPVLKPLNSSIRDHSLETSHDILKNNFSIVFSSSSYNLRTSESIFIKQYSPSLNNTESSSPLNILG